ncbi:MAG: zinc ribbon domain-containing protein [Candidatus Methanoperedens sp.]
MVQYCSNCGSKFDEKDKFCKDCGKQLSVIKMEIKERRNKNSEEITPYEEETTSYEEETDNRFSWAIGIIVIISLAGIYLFTSESRTIAVSVPYQEAIYETRYSGLLKDTGISTTSWTIKDATSYTSEYTGKDLWGTPAYTVKVCSSSSCTNYPQINYIDISSYSILTGYKTNYKTEYQEVTKTRFEWLNLQFN